MEEIYCDKCESTDLTDELIVEQPKIERKKMSEVRGTSMGNFQSSTNFPVVFPKKLHEITCRSCGFKVRYTSDL